MRLRLFFWGLAVVLGFGAFLFWNAVDAGTSWPRFFQLLQSDENREVGYIVAGWFLFMSFSNSGGDSSSPTYNPANGLPMISGSNLDINGNNYGTDRSK